MRAIVMRVMAAVAAAWEIDIEKLLSGSREKFISEPRFFAMCLLAEQPTWFCTRIARELDVNHSTVIHGVKRAKELIEIDKNYAACAQRARKFFADENLPIPAVSAPAKQSPTWTLRYPDPDFPGQFASVSGDPAGIIAHILRVFSGKFAEPAKTSVQAA